MSKNIDDCINSDLVTKEIKKNYDSIFTFGEMEGDKRIVEVQHILKKFKSKPEAAAKVIYSTFDLFENAIIIIKHMKKENVSLLIENNDLKKVRSVSDIAENTGQNILKYMFQKISTNTQCC